VSARRRDLPFSSPVSRWDRYVAFGAASAHKSQFDLTRQAGPVGVTPNSPGLPRARSPAARSGVGPATANPARYYDKEHDVVPLPGPDGWGHVR